MSFANRVENGRSFAKEPATHGLRRGPRSVGRVRAPLFGPRRVLCMRAGGTPGWAELSLAGHAVKSFSNFSVNYKCLFNIVFS